MSLPLTSRNLFNTFKEFTEVWVNQILYYRGIYGAETFDKFLSFGQSVFINRNPNLKQYISELIDNLIGVLTGHEINKRNDGRDTSFFGSRVNALSVIVYDERDDKVVARYILHFRDMMLTIGETIGKIHGGEDNSSIINLPGVSWEVIQAQFSAVLFSHCKELKRTCIDMETSCSENNLSFKIVVEVDDSIKLENTTWVLHQQNKTDFEKPAMKSIGDVNLTLLNFDTYNEYY